MFEMDHKQETVLFGLNFTDNIHYKFKSSPLRKPGFRASIKHTGAKQNLTQNGYSVIQGHVFRTLVERWYNNVGLFVKVLMM